MLDRIVRKLDVEETIGVNETGVIMDSKAIEVKDSVSIKVE